MPVKLTPAQAKALGVSTDAAEPGAPRRRRGGGRRRAPDPYHTVCQDCGEHFHTAAAETRHLNQTRHACYQLVLQLASVDGGGTVGE